VSKLDGKRHPISATGAVLTKLIHSMRRDALNRGLVTLCIGGGQGIALAIEVLRPSKPE
jgi:acetyl-CoA C-acetyltransferase